MEGSPFVYALIGHGVKNEITLYAVKASEFGTRGTWRKLVDVDDAVTRDSTSAARTSTCSRTRTPPSSQVIRIKADAPTSARPRSLCRSSSGVLTAVAVAKDALYCGSSRVVWAGCDECPSASQLARGLAPVEWRHLDHGCGSTEAGMLLPLESWTRSRLWYQYTPGQPQPSDTRLVAPAKVDVSDYQSIETEVPSHDG